MMDNLQIGVLQTVSQLQIQYHQPFWVFHSFNMLPAEHPSFLPSAMAFLCRCPGVSGEAALEDAGNEIMQAMDDLDDFQSGA